LICLIRLKIAVEDMHGSSILQQSMNEMQNLQNQRSFYSDTQCKILKNKNNSQISWYWCLATTTLNNRSVISKPLVNTSVFSPLHTTVSVQPNTSIVQSSVLNGGVSRADLPYRSLAQFGVLSKYENSPLRFELISFDLLEFKRKCSMSPIHIYSWVH
jgi:hypothetical protein